MNPVQHLPAAVHRSPYVGRTGRSIGRIGRIGCHRQPRGFALVVVLVILTAVLLLSATGMGSVGVGERAIANERDRALAFQAAESAGREALALVVANNASAAAPGYYAMPLLRGGNAEFWRTTSGYAADGCYSASLTGRFDWAACAVNASATYGNAIAPQYVIERMPVAVVNGISEEWYRITVRASGGTQSADVILQVMAKR